MKNRRDRKHKFGLSNDERYQMQIKALQKQVSKLGQLLKHSKDKSKPMEHWSEMLTRKDGQIHKLKDRVLMLEKKLGNKVVQIQCSQHGFNFSYESNCPECKEKNNGTNTTIKKSK